VASLLEGGAVVFLKKQEDAVPGARTFLAPLVERAGPESSSVLNHLAREGLAGLVARRLLAATGGEWGWNAEGYTSATGWGLRYDRRGYRSDAPGPWLLFERDEVGRACYEPALRDAIAAHAADERREVALMAVRVLRGDEGERATDALARALGVADEEVRSEALVAIASRGDRGVAAIRAATQRPEHTERERRTIRDALLFAPQEPATALLAQMVARNDPQWSDLWPALRRRDEVRAFELALAAADGCPEKSNLLAAQRVLTQTNDPRRIDVFMQILAVPVQGDKRLVLETVGEQYIVELGPETLEQLRDADAGIRKASTDAIERLKFYAEARRAFEK
jgi:hypothetical protein